MKKRLKLDINKADFLILDIPNDLTREILNKIEAREKRIAFFKISVFGIFVITSLFGVWVLSFNIYSELYDSGFFSFLSLIFSNYHSVMANFSDFIYSIMESIPALDIAFLLIIIGFFMWSLMSFIKEFLKIENKKQIFI